jgi:hypothetical protein
MDRILMSFESNKYVYLKSVLAEDFCFELTKELQELVLQKKTYKDPQCPLSEAIYGAETFDTLLMELLPYFESISKRKLAPTYSYARLYAPGDELKIHIDRPSCEISATITLGFDGEVWPFYVANDKEKTSTDRIDMKVGDATLYYGTEKYHWREKYVEGKWQSQVFLHYVDVDGPFKEHIYDKRDGLNLLPNLY